jgi:hypothetical protein
VGNEEGEEEEEEDCASGRQEGTCEFQREGEGGVVTSLSNTLVGTREVIVI